jgi:hypothetical protein
MDQQTIFFNCSMRVKLLLLFLCSSIAIQVVGAHATESWTLTDKQMLDLLSDGYDLKAVAGGPVTVVLPNGGTASYSQYIYILNKGTGTYRCQESDEAGSFAVTGCYELVRN